MNPFAWQQPYIEALEETDQSRMSHHILEAASAIEERMLSPLQVDSPEYHAINVTRLGLDLLRHRSEWGNNSSPAWLTATRLRER
jgi:hypothetical protein